MLTPALPFTGQAGWAFLQRTRPAQLAAFERQPQMQRDIQHFRDNIARIRSAEDLVADRRLLIVALGAFGLEGDISKKAFIRKVFEEGTIDPESLANRLPDKRYALMSSTFAFELNGTQFAGRTFQERIVRAFADRQFETAIGTQSTTMRLALGLERDLGSIVSGQNTQNGYWFAVMGTQTVRRVFETALGMPQAIAGLDIDRQLGLFKDAAQRIFGTSDLRSFAEPEKRGDLIRRFVIRADLDGLDRRVSSAGPADGPPGATAALAILQASTGLGTANGNGPLAILQALQRR